MEINLLGINHKTSSLEQRELLSMNEDDIRQILPQFLDCASILECVILSTCNRMEIITVTQTEFAIDRFLLDFFVKQYHYPSREYYPEFYFLKNRQVVEHLFKVSTGLDSMVIGETQIANQIRKAYSLAVHCQATGLYLNRLFHNAFHVSKKVSAETDINRGAGSVAFASIELCSRLFRDITSCKVLLIGAGKIGTISARNLNERKVKQLFIANRTYEKALQLADELKAMPLKMDEIMNVLPDMDIIISTLGSKGYIITPQMMAPILKKRPQKPLLLLDLAMPRDIDPALSQYEQINLVNIDGLKNIVAENLKKRQLELVKVQAIIQQETSHFCAWRCGLRIVPTIKHLKQRFEETGLKELDKFLKKNPQLNEAQLEGYTKKLINKIIQIPILKIRHFNSDCQSCNQYLPLIESIFDVKKDLKQHENYCRNQRKQTCSHPNRNCSKPTQTD